MQKEMNKLFENWNKFLNEESKDKYDSEVSDKAQDTLDNPYTFEQVEEMVRQELLEADPCWDGYQQIGMKDKDGKEVPNCVPLEEEELEEGFDKDRLKCNSPRYLKKGETGYGKKQKVVKACKKGKEKILKFGDANMENKSDNPENKADFRSRHDCKNKKDKFTAGYWSCKDW